MAKDTKSKCTLENLNEDCREIITKMCLKPDHEYSLQSSSPLIAALRSEAILYQEALDVFKAKNRFVLSRLNFEAFVTNTSIKTIEGIKTLIFICK